MRYLDKSFSVGNGSKSYRDNYNKVFSPKCWKCKKKYKKLESGKFQCKCGEYREDEI